jgi:hypothetical protein
MRQFVSHGWVIVYPPPASGLVNAEPPVEPGPPATLAGSTGPRATLDPTNSPGQRRSRSRDGLRQTAPTVQVTELDCLEVATWTPPSGEAADPANSLVWAVPDVQLPFQLSGMVASAT